jgi:ferredoxin-NADP reductase
MSIVKKYLAIIDKIDHPLPDIYMLTLSSPNGKFRYKPGQFLHLALDRYDPSRQWPESRCFSIQTNPDDEYLKITYSIKGDYTKRMAKELTLGKSVWIKLPYGELFSSVDPKFKCIFIAGGTGITPYLSLFTDKQFAQFRSPVLYLGVRSERYNIYQKEFEKGCSINPSFRIVVQYEDMEGLLNIERIERQNGPKGLFFLSGPPLMIKSFKNFLMNKNVPESNIKIDRWE